MVAQKVMPAEGGDAQLLIKRWIAPNPHRPSEVVLKEYGVAVWALVGYARGVDGDVAEVARAYDLPPDAVRAALAYYRQFPLQIDAKLAANAAWHTA
jgi:uncharacterized protein (DUF433 family)